MSTENRLEDALKRLARAAPQQASAEVERRLRARFRERLSRRVRVWEFAAELAASLVVGTALYLLLSHGRQLDQKQGSMPGLDQSSGFIALPYAQSAVPMEQAVIVRLDIRPSELSMMGLPVNAPSAGAKIRADLLVGQDGIARAVRLVH